MFTKIRTLVVCISLILVSLIHSNANANPVAELEKRYELMAPKGPGPFPTVIMFSGGSGFGHEDFAEHYDVIQKRLVGLGFLTVRMDVLGAIGAKNSRGVSYGAVAIDVRSAIKRLKANPKVRGDTLHLMGWSFGAAVSLTAITKPIDGVKSVMAYYPPCTWLSPWHTEATVKVFYGDQDTITPSVGCDSIFNSAKHGSESAIKVYPGAYHLFDFEHLDKDFVHPRLGIPMRYQEAAQRDAWNVTIDTLKK